MKFKTKQKTVEDAYEYFLREDTANLPYIYNNIIYNTFKGSFYARVEGCVFGDDQLACTREEFEAYAKEQKQETVKYAYEYYLNNVHCWKRQALAINISIDTRTDEEKLIDEIAELINDHIDDDAGSKCLAKEIINKIK